MIKKISSKESLWQKHVREIIFEVDTPAGKTFDIFLLWAIIFSVLTVLLESVTTIRQQYGWMLKTSEWFFTILFTIEYFLRLFSVKNPYKYAKSFYGVVDLLAVLPTYLSLYLTWSHSLIVIRGLRLLRIFRVLKLGRYIKEAQILLSALRASRVKITVFVMAILTVVLIIGTVMYLIEGEQNGFSSIPKSIYWAIVTMTTVGYGDITPKTIPGQMLSAIIMILGYGIIAVPTGIMSVELVQAVNKSYLENEKHPQELKICQFCQKGNHPMDANYCQYCGKELASS